MNRLLVGTWTFKALITGKGSERGKDRITGKWEET